MEHPDRVLQHAARLLNKDGKILIRIPVAGSFAWRKYREYWYQIDAPRHFFIPTPRSMQILAERCGLKIERIFFDSDTSQFSISEAYMRDIPLSRIEAECGKYGAGSQEYQATTLSLAKLLNAIGDGDSGGFVLSRHPSHAERRNSTSEKIPS
jgi:hypothetical protein